MYNVIFIGSVTSITNVMLLIIFCVYVRKNGKIKLLLYSSHLHFDIQIISGVTNFRNPGKVKMYGHSRSVL